MPHWASDGSWAAGPNVCGLTFCPPPKEPSRPRPRVPGLARTGGRYFWWLSPWACSHLKINAGVDVLGAPLRDCYRYKETHISPRSAQGPVPFPAPPKPAALTSGSMAATHDLGWGRSLPSRKGTLMRRETTAAA